MTRAARWMPDDIRDNYSATQRKCHPYPGEGESASTNKRLLLALGSDVTLLNPRYNISEVCASNNQKQIY